MANSALAVLESALRERKLDRTLTTALPPLEYGNDVCAPTGVAAIDACLRNGVPRGQLSELAGPRSSGRTTLLLQMLAAATRRGELAALVDTFDRLDVASAETAGIDLSRLLWIRGQALSAASGDEGHSRDSVAKSAHGMAKIARGGGPVEWAVDRALKALNLVLQAGGFGVVAIDLADAPGAALRHLPFTTWLRVQRAVEGRDTACVLVTPEPIARSAGGITLTLASHTAWTGSCERPRVAGADVHLRVVSPRRRVGGEVTVMARAAEGGIEPAAAGLPNVAAGLPPSPKATADHRSFSVGG
jgi:recombination protein RecA